MIKPLATGRISLYLRPILNRLIVNVESTKSKMKSDKKKPFAKGNDNPKQNKCATTTVNLIQ